MTTKQIREGLTVDPFTTRVQKVQDHWSVEWDYDGVPAGKASFVETDEGLEWTRFWVSDEFRDRGLYTQALRFSADNGGASIRAETREREFYLSAGFKEKDGWLRSDKRAVTKFLKGR